MYSQWTTVFCKGVNPRNAKRKNMLLWEKNLNLKKQLNFNVKIKADKVFSLREKWVSVDKY